LRPKPRRPASGYVDDIAVFLEPATALGLKTVHFRSAEQLIADLITLGVSADFDAVT
jgi:hypothetical protein